MLKLLPSEEKEKEDWGQLGYRQFFDEMNAAGVSISALNSVLAAAVTGWFAGRSGRKIRLKVGDVEVEACSIKDIEQLLEQAKAFQAGQPEVKHEA